MAYKTISAAIQAAHHAQKSRTFAGRKFAVISAETMSGSHKGEYAVADAVAVADHDVYMFVHGDGNFCEGPKAKELPINAE